MKIGRSISTQIAAHATKVVSVHGWDADGNFNIGANKLVATELTLFRQTATTWRVYRPGTPEYAHFEAGYFHPWTGILFLRDARDISPPDVAGNYVKLQARGATTLEEIARLQGHATDPHLLLSKPVVLAPSATPTTPLEGHFFYGSTPDKLQFQDAAALQTIASNLVGAFTTLAFCSENAIGNDATFYVPAWIGTLQATDDLEFRAKVPVAGNLKNLYVEIDIAPGAGDNVAITVRVNGVDSALTCTISDTDLTGSDLVNSVAVAAGDTVSVKVVSSVTGGDMLFNIAVSLA